MALYLEGCSTAEIKMMGCWKSDAMLVYLCPMATNTFKHLSTKTTTNHHVLSMTTTPPEPKPINMDDTDNIRPELEHSFDDPDRSISFMHQLFLGIAPQAAISDNGPGHLQIPGVGLEPMLLSAQHSSSL
jgi:hypothetical protein